MVKLIVYGNKQTTCTQRILILLEELELKYDFENVDLMHNEHKTKQFFKLNPFGYVPAIKYGDNTLFESRSILRYIAKNNNDDIDLTLNDDYNVDMWLEAESQNFNPPISKIVNEKLFKKMRNEKCNDSIVETELENLKKVLNVYETHFSNKNLKYIAGDYYSIADISHIPYINYFAKAGYKHVLKEYPLTYEWIKTLISRKAVKSILNSN